jgi:hypothetical protein
MKSLVFSVAVVATSCHPNIGPVVPKTPVERQMIGLLEKFDRWDYNGDGRLDQKELSQGIQSLKGKPQEVDYSAVEVLEFYDANKDGKVSLKEAQEGYSRSHEAETVLRS